MVEHVSSTSVEHERLAIEPVLAHYRGLHPSRVTCLGSAGGFSGARFWRLDTAAGKLCLRAWPSEHPSRERLAWMHALLAHVCKQGFSKVPVPLRDGEGRSIIRSQGRDWELTPWMPGRADYLQRPSRTRLANALEALARFHLAAEGFPPSEQERSQAFSVVAGKAGDGPLAAAPGMLERKKLLAGFLGEESVALAEAMDARVWPELFHRGRRIVELFARVAPRVFSELEQAATVAVPRQPCLRDVHHDHVFFVGEEVSALIDFGAARYECVAADLARLLGSLAGDESSVWQRGLEAYHGVRPLRDEERRLVPIYDRSGVALSPMLWLRRVFLEGRHFDRPRAVLRRIDQNRARLERLAKDA